MSQKATEPGEVPKHLWPAMPCQSCGLVSERVRYAPIMFNPDRTVLAGYFCSEECVALAALVLTPCAGTVH